MTLEEKVKKSDGEIEHILHFVKMYVRTVWIYWVREDNAYAIIEKAKTH